MTKEQLQQYRSLKREYKQIEEELGRLETLMTSPRIQELTGMPRGGGSGDALAALVARHIELQERYRSRLSELAAAQLAVEEAIDTLAPDERRLMRYRYIDGLRWEDICPVMNYSWRQVHRIHAQALDKLRE